MSSSCNEKQIKGLFIIIDAEDNSQCYRKVCYLDYQSIRYMHFMQCLVFCIVTGRYQSIIRSFYSVLTFTTVSKVCLELCKQLLRLPALNKQTQAHSTVHSSTNPRKQTLCFMSAVHTKLNLSTLP